MSAADPRERFVEAQERLLERYDMTGASSFVTIEDPVEEVHYLSAGQGSPVVLLPGVASPAALFVPLMAELTEVGSLYAIDRPGRALSDPYYHEKGDVRAFTRATLDNFLEAIHAETVDLVASSFGGFQAMAYALDRPDRIDRISFVGSPAGLTKNIAISFRLLGVRGINRLMFRMIANDTIEETRESMEALNVTDASGLSDELLDVILRGGQLPEQAASLKTLFETTSGLRGVSKHMLVRDEIDRLEGPLQFVWGSEDYFYDPSLGRELFGHREDVTFEVLEGHGHTPWLEPDNDVAERIAAFFE